MLSAFLNVALFVGVFCLILLFAGSGDKKADDARRKRAA